VRARAASQERLERTLRLNTVVAQWEQDLASIQQTDAVQDPLTCDGASVRLTRRTPTGLQVVAWTLRPDAGGTAGFGTLDRWAGPSVTTTGELTDSWLRSLQLQGGEPGQLRTLRGLSQWQVYFFRDNAWSNCQSTGEIQTTLVPPGGSASGAGTGGSAGGRQRTALPKGVRVVLSFAPGSGLNGDLTRDVLLGP